MAEMLFLEIKVTGGDIVLDFFPAHQPLRVTKRSALERLKFERSKTEDFVEKLNPDDFVITLDEGMLLDETKTLAALGISEHAVLCIEHRATRECRDVPLGANNRAVEKGHEPLKRRSIFLLIAPRASSSQFRGITRNR